ncbi:MAG TPA: sialidase family protein [Thermoanaerobaculia bacterium]|nr:sialidase family protein [Thermoanaerobaculia bacterium]
MRIPALKPAPRVWLLLGLAIALAPRGLAHEKHVGTVTGVLGLDLYASGDVVDALLAVQEDGAKAIELRHVRSTDGGRTWGPAAPILKGKAAVFSPRRGAEPQIAASGDRIVVIWTEPGSSPWGSGALASAVSPDGGRTWRKGPTPADDGTTKDHGFVDVAAFGPNRFLAVWLDSRDGEQGLRSAVSPDAGASWGKNVDVDARTCECCANRLLVRQDRADVIYRDLDPRDMAVATTTDGGRSWRKVGAAGPFGWKFDGCPEVGGALAVTEAAGLETLHALVWTGKGSEVGVWRLSSGDRGLTWSKPARMGDAAAKHLDMAASGACVAAVWDQYLARGKRSVVLASVSCDGGRIWSKPNIISAPNANATHPLAVATPRGILAAWTERTGAGPIDWKTRALWEAPAAPHVSE